MCFVTVLLVVEVRPGLANAPALSRGMPVDSGLAVPNTTPAAHHQERAILALGEGQVGKPFNDAPAPRFEFEFLVLPRAIHTVTQIVALNNINDISSIPELEHLWIMPRPDAVLYFVRAGGLIRHGMYHDRSGPLVVPT